MEDGLQIIFFKWKTTSKKNENGRRPPKNMKMEDNLKKMKMEDDLKKKWKWKTTSKQKMEDDLKKEMEDNLKKWKTT